MACLAWLSEPCLSVARLVGSSHNNSHNSRESIWPRLLCILIGEQDRAGVHGKVFFVFFAGDGPLEWVRPIPKAPERSWHASGPSFRPNRRFSTHFKLNLMFWDGTGTLVNQDWTWAEAWADLGLRPTLDDLWLSLGPLLDQPWANFLLNLGNFWPTSGRLQGEFGRLLYCTPP